MAVRQLNMKGVSMLQEVYFLNHSVFTSKKNGTTYRKLVCSTYSGEVMELFHDENVLIPNPLRPFAPIIIETEIVPYGRGFNLRLTSIKVKEG